MLWGGSPGPVVRPFHSRGAGPSGRLGARAGLSPAWGQGGDWAWREDPPGRAGVPCPGQPAHTRRGLRPGSAGCQMEPWGCQAPGSLAWVGPLGRGRPCSQGTLMPGSGGTGVGHRPTPLTSQGRAGPDSWQGWGRPQTLRARGPGGVGGLWPRGLHYSSVPASGFRGSVSTGRSYSRPGAGL